MSYACANHMEDLQVRPRVCSIHWYLHTWVECFLCTCTHSPNMALSSLLSAGGIWLCLTDACLSACLFFGCSIVCLVSFMGAFNSSPQASIVAHRLLEASIIKASNKARQDSTCSVCLCSCGVSFAGGLTCLAYLR